MATKNDQLVNKPFCKTCRLHLPNDEECEICNGNPIIIKEDEI
jgi:hypothetical protein